MQRLTGQMKKMPQKRYPSNRERGPELMRKEPIPVWGAGVSRWEGNEVAGIVTQRPVPMEPAMAMSWTWRGARPRTVCVTTGADDPSSSLAWSLLLALRDGFSPPFSVSAMVIVGEVMYMSIVGRYQKIR